MSTDDDVTFTRFKDETQLQAIIALISNDLSEPYSIYVYRYFIQQWLTMRDFLADGVLGPTSAFWYLKH
jgi:hypothetical protein